MRQRLCFAGMLLGLFAGVSAPAWAETDHLCLRQCVSSGKPSGGCLSACSYGKTPVQPSSANLIFKPIVPLGQNIVIRQKDGASPALSEKDHLCQRRCLQEGITYGLCEKRCTKGPK